MSATPLHPTVSPATPSFQWLRMAITMERPKHVWHAGKGFPGDAFDGFTAHTDDHVWMEARGGGATPDGGGTMLVQSEGQYWMQSTEGALSFVAGANIVFGTTASPTSGFKLATAGGTAVIADRRVVSSTVPIASPTEALSSENTAADLSRIWGELWLNIDRGVARGFNLFDHVLWKVIGGLEPFGLASGVKGLGLLKNVVCAGATMKGIAGSIAGTSTSRSVTFAGEAGILIGAELGVTLWGLGGCVLGSAFPTAFAGVSTTAMAGRHCAMQAVGPLDMSGGVSATIGAVSFGWGVGVDLASRWGAFGAKALTTVTTKAGYVEGRALKDAYLTVPAGWIDLASDLGSVALKAAGLTVLAGRALHAGVLPGAPPGTPVPLTPVAPLDTPPVAVLAGPRIDIGTAIEMFGAAAEPVLTIDARGVTFAHQGRSLSVMPTDVTLRDPGGALLSVGTAGIVGLPIVRFA